MPSVQRTKGESVMEGKKAAGERRIFRRFAKACGLEVAPHSVRSCKSSYPDISCRIKGVRRYFELTRMVHRSFVNAVGHSLGQTKGTGVPPPPEAAIYDDRLALKETIARKATKHYDHACSPLDLLIYTDGVLHPPRMRPEWAQAILREEGETASLWDRLWLYDSVYDRVLARWPDE
jgi:hypothetical protein